MMKHDLSGKFWTDTLEMKGDRGREGERQRKEGSGVIPCLGKLKQFKAAASNHREILRQTAQRQIKGHTAGCLAGW